jgi:hypothetical protein
MEDKKLQKINKKKLKKDIKNKEEGSKEAKKNPHRINNKGNK